MSINLSFFIMITGYLSYLILFPVIVMMWAKHTKKIKSWHKWLGYSAGIISTVHMVLASVKLYRMYF